MFNFIFVPSMVRAMKEKKEGKEERRNKIQLLFFGSGASASGYFSQTEVSRDAFLFALVPEGTY